MRELSITVTVQDAQARAKLGALDRTMASVGAQTAMTTQAVGAYDKQVKSAGSSTSVASTAIDAYVQTATKATTAANSLTTKLADYTKTVDNMATVSSGKALKAADDLIAKLDAEEAATGAATVATQGLGTQIMGTAAAMAPYAIAAAMVTEVVIGWWEAHQKAALATQEAAAKQDTIARAFQLSHGVTMPYANAVKFLNEQFEKQPAFVDHAVTALEHWKVALQQGPLNAQTFAADDLAKNITNAQATVQKELGRLNIDTLNKALDELRSHTVLGDAAFNQWAKDIGLSSVTVGVLRESVAAEDKAQQAAAQATAKHTSELKRQVEAYERLVESQMKSIRAGMLEVTQQRLRAGGTPLQEQFPFIGPMPEDLEVLPPSGAFLDAARLGNLNLKNMVTPWIDKQLATDTEQFRRELDDLAGAMVQLSQVSGDSFGGLAQELANIVVSWNAASKAAQQYAEAETFAGKAAAMVAGVAAVAQATGSGSRISRVAGGALAGAQLGSAFGPWGTAIGAGAGGLIGALRSGPSAAELAGRDTSAQFEGQFKNFADMVNSMGDAYATIGGDRADAQSAVKAMLDAQVQGAEAVRTEVERLQGVLDEAAKVRQGASRYGLNSEQLQVAATDAQNVVDYMTRSNLYTQDQLNQAYYDWQKAMADAGDAAAAAWVKTKTSAVDATGEASSAMSALQQQRDSLAQSIANEAPEDVMGVIQAQISGQVDALDAQIADQQVKLETQAQAAAAAVEGAFADVRITIPIDFSYEVPEFNGGINPFPAPIDPIPQATGGDWWVTKPTLFLAGEAGPERATFTPQGRGGGNQSGGRDGSGEMAAMRADLQQLRRTLTGGQFAQQIAYGVVVASAKQGPGRR